MGKTVDTTLLGARLRDFEQKIQNARFLEKLGMEGNTPEDVIKEAKDFLQLDDSGVITAEANNIVTKYNLEAKAFLELVNFKSKAKEAGIALSANEAKALMDIEKRVAENLSKRYDIEVDELYMEDE